MINHYVHISIYMCVCVHMANAHQPWEVSTILTSAMSKAGHGPATAAVAVAVTAAAAAAVAIAVDFEWPL